MIEVIISLLSWATLAIWMFRLLADENMKNIKNTAIIIMVIISCMTWLILIWKYPNYIYFSYFYILNCFLYIVVIYNIKNK